MFKDKPFESIAKIMSSMQTGKFDVELTKAVFQPVQDNLTAWGELARSHGKAAQASFTESLESLKVAKEPQASFLVLKSFTENFFALSVKHIKEAADLGVAQYHSTLENLETDNPEAFAQVAKTFKNVTESAKKAMDAAVMKTAYAIEKAVV